MKNSLQVGRIAGIPIQFHWTFLLVGVWLMYDSWRPGRDFNWDNFQWLLLWIGMVFLAVLLHELGHALVARRMGIGTDRIVLYPLGGGAFLEKIPEVPREEIWIALAGPAVNFLLAGLVAPIIWWGGNDHLQQILQLFLRPKGNIVIFDAALWEYMIVVFFLLNMLLGTFNLIPAFPLDGGRVLRALLSKKYSRTRATVLAGRIGMAGAVILLAIGIYQGDYIFAIGAVVIFSLALFEIKIQKRRGRLSDLLVRDHLRADFNRLYLAPGRSLQDARRMISGWTEEHILLLDQWQQPHGITTRQALLNTDLDGQADEPLAILAGPARWQGLGPDDTLLSAAEKLDKHQVFAFAVVDKYGRVLGLLDRTVIEQIVEQ